MNKPNIALYAGDSLGESQIVNNLAATRQVGWTTVILGLFHIGYPPDWPEAKIFFNDTGVIDGGKYLGDFSWPNNIAQLKQNGSSVTQIYASFGEAPRSRILRLFTRSMKATTTPSTGHCWRKT